MSNRQSPDSTPLRVAPPARFRAYGERQLERIPALARFSAQQRFAMRVVARVLPFRVNQYVLDELIDWDRAPDDPMFRLTFPQPEMLAPGDFARMADALRSGADEHTLERLASDIRARLSPHPAGQATLNVPSLEGETLPGMQHKYRETVLFFPARGQTCHSYCTFCFRWPQFVGSREQQFSATTVEPLRAYLRAHPEVTDLLLTGGDPLVMNARNLAACLEPLLEPELESLQTIRIGTKSLAFWPQRFVHDADADDLLRLLERLVKAGKHVALMAHYNHWRELETGLARRAIERIRATGTVIRTQAPALRHISDSADLWARLWRTQVKLGLVPYYLFVERDTGARHYFELPLARALDIYQGAMRQLSGIARTARGPSMSTAPGKIEIQGISEVRGEKVFVLRFIQARRPEWTYRPFFARFDDRATWLDQLRPAFGEERFFFEEDAGSLSGHVADFDSTD